MDKQNIEQIMPDILPDICLCIPCKYFAIINEEPCKSCNNGSKFEKPVLKPYKTESENAK